MVLGSEMMDSTQDAHNSEGEVFVYGLASNIFHMKILQKVGWGTWETVLTYFISMCTVMQI